MGLRGPKPGYRDAQREHAGKQAAAGRPRYAKGDGRPMRKIDGAVAKLWKKRIEALGNSGNVLAPAYPLLEELCQIEARLPILWDQFDNLQRSEPLRGDLLNELSLTINRMQGQQENLCARFGFDPKSYLAMVEASPAPSGPTSIDRILAS